MENRGLKVANESIAPARKPYDPRYTMKYRRRLGPGDNRGGTKAENLPCLGRRRRAAREACAAIDHLLHQLGVARGEAVGLDAQVVLQAGAHVAAGLEAPLVHLPLVAADAGGDPGGA